MTTSHAAASAVASVFLKRENPSEAEVEHFYAEVFPQMAEGQRALIFDWIVASVETVTREDVAKLTTALRDREDFGVASDADADPEIPAYARGF